MDNLDTPVEVQRGERRPDTVRVRIGPYYGLVLPSQAHVAALTTTKMRDLHKRLQAFPFVFDDDHADNEQAFQELLLSPYTAIIELNDDQGVFIATELHPRRTASVHALFWDRSLADKVQLCRDMLAWLFNTFDLHRIEVYLPMLRAYTSDSNVNVLVEHKPSKSFNDRRLDPLCRAAARFNTKVGMRLEGRLRESFLRFGEWHDTFVFGLTRARLEVLYG